MAALAAGNPDAFERTEFYYDWARPNRYDEIVRGNAPATLIVERSDGRPPLRLEPVRLGPAADLIDLRTPQLLLLLVDDPEMNTGAVVALLRERYGLTATEAVVAFHAARGKGLASVARAVGIGQGTVRSHLERVFGKTQTDRQAELAWVVSEASK